MGDRARSTDHYQDSPHRRTSAGSHGVRPGSVTHPNPDLHPTSSGGYKAHLILAAGSRSLAGRSHLRPPARDDPAPTARTCAPRSSSSPRRTRQRGQGGGPNGPCWLWTLPGRSDSRLSEAPSVMEAALALSQPARHNDLVVQETPELKSPPKGIWWKSFVAAWLGSAPLPSCSARSTFAYR